MPKFACVLDVRDPPEKVIAAMLDFSLRSGRTSRPRSTRLVAENTATVTEGTDIPAAERGSV
jgi:hypothetical protein